MRIAPTLLCAAVLAAASAPIFAAGDIAIIVNKANKLDELSAKDLKRIFAGDKARWPDGSGIVTMAVSANAPEHKTAIQFLYGMGEAEFQRYCIHANFVGEAQKIPRDSGTSAAVANLVSAIPGAIGFVNASAITPAVKVIKIDGHAPGDSGYPLADSK